MFCLRMSCNPERLLIYTELFIIIITELHRMSTECQIIDFGCFCFVFEIQGGESLLNMHPQRLRRPPHVSRQLLAEYRADQARRQVGFGNQEVLQAPHGVQQGGFQDNGGQELPDDEGNENHQAEGAVAAIPDDVLLSDSLMELYARHKMSMNAMEDVVKLLNLTREEVAPVRSFKTIKRDFLLQLPTVLLDIEFLDRDVDRIDVKLGLNAVPEELFNNARRYELRYIISRISAAEVRALYESQHEHAASGDLLKVTLASDSVPISKSGARSLDVISLQVKGCSTVYPLVLYEPFVKVKMDVNRSMQHIFQDLENAGFTLEKVIGDLPKRGELQGLKQHGGYFCCPFCEVEGIHSEVSETVVYPVTYNEMPRTHESIQAIAEGVEDGTLYDEQDTRGVKMKSPFFELENFDIVQNFPIDTMHNVYLGVVKRLFYRTFKCEYKKTNASGRKRQNLKAFNEAYKVLSVPQEQTRKPRGHNAYWKANEYKCLVLMHFPVLLSTLRHHPDPERRLLSDIWALLCYIVHVLYLPVEKEQALSIPLQLAVKEFTTSLEQYLTIHQFVFNIHFFSHLPEVHSWWGPVSGYSAFPSENMYRLLLNGLCRGTRSVGKQALQNVMLNYFCRKPHRCKRSLLYKDNCQGRTADCYVYTSDLSVYRIDNIPTDNQQSLRLKRYGISPYEYKTSKGMDIPFKEIGVFRQPVLLNNHEYLERSELVGKCIVTEDYAICLPPGVFQEASF